MTDFPYNINNPDNTGKNLLFLGNLMPAFYKKDGSAISDILIFMDEAVLSSGSVEVDLPRGGFDGWYMVVLSVNSKTASSNDYCVDYHSQNKFVIKSSDASDSSKIRWMAIGY